MRSQRIYEQNSEYPPGAKNAGTDGRVDARFIVDKNGEIGGISIINNFGYGSKEEALRLINLMKEESLIWKPGVLDGKLVHTAYDVTFRFQR
jgi:protein TonB